MARRPAGGAWRGSSALLPRADRRVRVGASFGRSLDLLHVAAAHVTSCTRFVSGAECQLAIAKASGVDR